MNATTSTETPALKTRAQLLSELRNRIRSSVGVDGIYLTYHSRYEGSLKDVVKLVKSLDGFIAEQGKAGKVRFREDHSTTRPYFLVFSIGIDEDIFLERGVHPLPLVRA